MKVYEASPKSRSEVVEAMRAFIAGNSDCELPFFAEDLRSINILESFYYLRKNENFMEIVKHFGSFLLDSGAFTFMSGSHKGGIDWDEIFRGYNPLKKPKITTFENEEHSVEMVFDSGDYYSMCEHHVLPFFGQYYFAYIPSPNGRILGISKVARVVGYCAARLQLQERLAIDIVKMLNDALDGKALGFAIVMKGQHLCKSMRGVRNNGKMTVSCFTGIFKNNSDKRNEFYNMIKMQ